MNKPAAKDPSMDEILSSIRQIIADDDVQDGSGEIPSIGEKESPAIMADKTGAAPAEAPASDEEPLALSVDQMVSDAKKPEEELPEVNFNPASEGAEVVAKTTPDPEPVPDPENEADLDAALAQSVSVPDDTGEGEKEIKLIVAEDIAFEDPDDAEEIEVPPEAAAMPDPDLSADMADKLLAPTTDAAVRHTFSKLNSLAIGGADLTLEAIVRDMLRPMLKEWLDENLPATVERMVEREIERVSRGE